MSSILKLITLGAALWSLWLYPGYATADQTTSESISWARLPLEYSVRARIPPTGVSSKLVVLLNVDYHFLQCDICRQLYSDVDSVWDGNRNFIKGLEFEADVRFMILAPEEPLSSTSPDYWPNRLADRIVCGSSPELNLRVVMQDDEFRQLLATNTDKALRAKWPLDRKIPPGGTRGTSVPPENECDSAPALAAVRNFAKAHGLTGTPLVLVSGDGRVHRGYLPPEQLMRWLGSRN